MDAYQVVKEARKIDRLSTIELINTLCSRFIELHGDRQMKDDQAIVSGVGLIEEKEPITIIGLQKGSNTTENIQRNFGSSGPAGYRKAQRMMKQAEKFNRPVLTLINTAGADARPESEKNGIGEAIASSLKTMSELSVPTLAIILGEGGSGGAIALALADEVWMLENSIYSILSPEGFASILWKDANRAEEAAEVMRLTATELKELAIIDRIIPETKADEKYNNQELAEILTKEIKETFHQLKDQSLTERKENRYQRFRKF
ncbi:MAG: acetyl-CoA carboxylase carboxyl transferase subunit alpha [Atopostipes suicloacalis]|nr:acetyl-CoA carboxylase carboxyl transferase subunit alpha [Atopostipes suicloacalis]MDN6731522.1 acetyl-CoA carboxylase carboxyl transferase subunit alpha [Atopostipes suicloacalis]